MRKILSCLLVLAFGTGPAWGALGQSEASVHADRQQMAGQMKSATFQRYTVHEITGAGGIIVREYVSPAGMVFGVAWESATMPNLPQLLGPYFAPVRQAIENRRVRGPLYVQSGPLIVESGGRMRAFRGRAYLTNLIPAELTKDVVR